MTPREVLEVVGAGRRDRPGIYMIHCAATDKCYVGQSVNINSRIGLHRSELRRGLHHNSYLQAAWNKHGEETFSFYVLTNCPLSGLNAQEEFWVCQIDRAHLFNLGDVGDGYPRTPEHCQRISDAKKGRGFSESHREALSRARRGIPATPEKMEALNAGRARYLATTDLKAVYTEEIRAKMSAKAKGRAPSEKTRTAFVAYARGPRTEEHKAKIGAAKKGFRLSPESIEKMKATKAARPQPAWNKGAKLSAEHRAKMSAAKQGKPGRQWTDEQKQRAAESARRRWARQRGEVLDE